MDIIQVYLTRFLSQQDEKLCEKDPTRSKSVYYPYFLHNYYDESTLDMMVMEGVAQLT
jgi:hypothetical protein